VDLHIDDFRRDCAIILLRLYNHFPRQYSIYISEITQEGYEDEFGLINARYEACLATMYWLAEENLLTYKSEMPNEGIEQATLTLKGYQLLLGYSTLKQISQDLSSTEDQEAQPQRRIQHIREALRSQSSAQMEIVMDEFFLSIKC